MLRKVPWQPPFVKARPLWTGWTNPQVKIVAREAENLLQKQKGMGRLISHMNTQAVIFANHLTLVLLIR